MINPRKALFGVSVDSRAFSTAAVTAGLAAGLRDYDEIVFLIADKLQIYNAISKESDDFARLSTLDWQGVNRNDVHERKQWLAKVRLKLPDWPARQSWRIVGIDAVADAKGFRTQRAVRILYETDLDFRADVDRHAAVFTADRHGRDDVARRMSVLYILEEIALNIRLRVFGRIHDEFYMGRTFQIFINIYRGKYARSVFDLSGASGTGADRFRFMDWNASAATWIDRSDAPKVFPLVRSTG